MEIMVFGLLLWSLVHLVPSLAPSVKKGWISMLGENGYKISFSAIVIFSLVMIVYGWRHSDPVVVYTLSIDLKPVALILMVVAFVLFGAAQYPTRIKTYVRHPQLTSIIVWSIANLLVNGDSRSIIMFGSMALWAVLEIIAINRRSGEWEKAAPPAWPREIKGLVISLVIFAVVAFAHPYIAGVSLT